MQHTVAVTRTSLCILRRYAILATKCITFSCCAHQFILEETAEASGFGPDFGYRQSGPFQYNWSVTVYPDSPQKKPKICLQ